MPRKYFRQFLPSHESIRQNRFARLAGSLLSHHNLWHLHRRSVAGGVAVGLFTGLIPGPFQMLGAAIFAIVFRVNLPVAVFTTLYTNPFTFVPIYVIAYHIGAFLTGEHGHTPSLMTDGLVDWLVALGRPLLVGVPVLGAALATIGYFAVRGAWRLYVVREWRKRQERRKR